MNARILRAHIHRSLNRTCHNVSVADPALQEAVAVPCRHLMITTDAALHEAMAVLVGMDMAIGSAALAHTMMSAHVTGPRLADPWTTTPRLLPRRVVAMMTHTVGTMARRRRQTRMPTVARMTAHPGTSPRGMAVTLGREDILPEIMIAVAVTGKFISYAHPSLLPFSEHISVSSYRTVLDRK